MIPQPKTLTIRAANDVREGPATCETSVLSIARLLARHSAQTAKAANDNRHPETKR
jgi:hypothetical protein